MWHELCRVHMMAQVEQGAAHALGISDGQALRKPCGGPSIGLGQISLTVPKYTGAVAQTPSEIAVACFAK